MLFILDKNELKSELIQYLEILYNHYFNHVDIDRQCDVAHIVALRLTQAYLQLFPKADG